VTTNDTDTKRHLVNLREERVARLPAAADYFEALAAELAATKAERTIYSAGRAYSYSEIEALNAGRASLQRELDEARAALARAVDDGLRACNERDEARDENIRYQLAARELVATIDRDGGQAQARVEVAS